MSRVLIVAPAWVGDMVMAQSLVAALVRRDPKAEIDLLAPPWTAPLGERMPGVRRAISMPSEHGRFDLVTRLSFGRALHSEGDYDLAIVLPRSLKSAIVPFVAGVPLRRGYLGEARVLLLNDIRRLDKQAAPRTVDRFVALASGRGEAAPDVTDPVLSLDRRSAEAVAARHEIDLANPLIGLCPGAEYGPAKQWPAGHFAEAAARLAEGRRSVVLFGSPKDAAICDEIVRLAGPRAAVRNLAGRTSLLEAVDLIGLCAGVISNDSGLMHVAAALRRPLVAIYGSSSPVMTPPLSPRVAVEALELSCRPCFERTCPLGHLACLTGLEANRVVQSLEALLAGSGQ